MADQSVPIRGIAYTVDFVIRKNDGSIIAAPTGLAGRIAKDGAVGAATAAAPTNYDPVAGFCSCALNIASMTADRIALVFTSTSTGAVPTEVYLYPTTLGVPVAPATLTTAYDPAKDTSATVATAVRTNLAIELARIDVAVSTRAPEFGGRIGNIDGTLTTIAAKLPATTVASKTDVDGAILTVAAPTFTGTVTASPVTVNPTTLAPAERTAIATAVDTTLTTAHPGDWAAAAAGAGGALTTVQDAHLMAIPTTGGATVDPALVAASLIPLLEASPKLSHTPTGWVLVTHATVGQSRCTDQSANPLGGVVITAYLETDIERYNPLNDSASSNVVGHVGEWGILVPPGGIRDLVFVSPNQTSVTTKVTV